MNHGRSQTGFTIVELMLAMAFVSALLLAIAMTVIQIGNIYNQGITFKGVEQAGLLITKNLEQSISSSSPFNINPGAGSRYINSAWGGRLCTGEYSYIWNYGRQMTNPNRNRYSTGSNDINFVKASDSGSAYCLNPTQNIDPATSIELINKNENTFAINNIAIHNFEITADANDDATGQRLYRIQLLVGTNDEDAINGALGGTTCKTADMADADPTYCAVNNFDLVIRAAGAKPIGG